MFFLYPSLYEGFGIPPLEAMANGCSILAADIEPLREVCGSAVEYCNPYETLSIVEGIRRMIENPELRNALVRKGYEQEKLYSWDLSVQKLKENLPE
jgi:glycosyltransferase involved in cell wall biosynthesis